MDGVTRAIASCVQKIWALWPKKLKSSTWARKSLQSLTYIHVRPTQETVETFWELIMGHQKALLSWSFWHHEFLEKHHKRSISKSDFDLLFYMFLAWQVKILIQISIRPRRSIQIGVRILLHKMVVWFGESNFDSYSRLIHISVFCCITYSSPRRGHVLQMNMIASSPYSHQHPHDRPHLLRGRDPR